MTGFSDKKKFAKDSRRFPWGPVRTISRDLVIALVCAVTCVSIITIFINYRMLSLKAEKQQSRKAAEYLSYLQDNLELPIWNHDMESVSKTASFFFRNELVAKLKITTPQGHILFKRVKEDETELIEHRGTVVHEDLLIGHIELGLTLRIYRENNLQLLRSSLITLFLVVVVLTVVTRFLLNKFLKKPLDYLHDRIELISNGNYQYRNHRYKQREIETIISKFNRMAEKIEMREEAMGHLRNHLQNIIDSMPSVMVGVDPAGRVTQWNLEAERQTGIKAKNAEGAMLTDVFPMLEDGMENVRRTIAGRTPHKDSKVARLNREGRPCFSDITIYPLFSNGIDGAVIRIDDVTERVRLEEMMIQSEKILSVGGLAAGMAHEINNPLAGILQNVQVMRSRLSGDLPKNRQVAEECGIPMNTIESYMKKRGILKMIESVMESGLRASEIVDNMLSFSRKSDALFSPCNLRELLDKTVELASSDFDLKKKYDFRRIEIVREYHEEIPETWCDENKVRQVFLNILTNGAQAMAEKRGETEHPRFTLRVLPEKEMIRVEIEDNGPGMDETTRKRVFEPFFTTKEIGMGTGLGLSVSYFIITENHSGTMSVESSPGKGAKFIIRLPIRKKN